MVWETRRNTLESEPVSKPELLDYYLCWNPKILILKICNNFSIYVKQFFERGNLKVFFSVKVEF